MALNIRNWVSKSGSVTKRLTVRVEHDLSLQEMTGFRMGW